VVDKYSSSLREIIEMARVEARKEMATEEAMTLLCTRRMRVCLSDEEEERLAKKETQGHKAPPSILCPSCELARALGWSRAEARWMPQIA